MSEFLFGPSPNDKAREFLTDKPPVSRDVFDAMLPEIRGRTFLITGIEDMNLVQDIRDRIADLPVGGDWEEIKHEVAVHLSPWLEDGAEKRAELLLRTHGYQAYAAAQKEVLDRQRDVFPYLMYQAAGDDRVRDSHQALDGVVLPADSPFWETHFPPWEFGCRCQVVPLQREDVEEIEAEDADLPPEARRVLDEYRLREIEAGTLHTTGDGNMPRRIDVRAPSERFGGSGFSASPGSLRIPVEELRKRYDSQVWRDFQELAQNTRLEDGRTMFEWLNNTPTPAPEIPPSAPAASIDELISVARIPIDGTATAEDMERLMEGLAKPDGATVSGVVSKISGTAAGALTRTSIADVAGEFLRMVPADIAAQLPKLDIGLTTRKNMGGFYLPGTGKLRLHRRLANDPVQMRRTLWHEMTHWLHTERKGGFPAAVKAHFEARTAGEAVVDLGGNYGPGKRDKWYDAYAGRIYNHPLEGTHLGLEVPTRYVELLTWEPEQLAEYWNHRDHGETLRMVLGGFFDD